MARRELVAQVDRGQLKPGARGTTVNQLLDLYLDGLDADCRLSAKTRFDYRHLADDYVRPHLGSERVRNVTPEVVLNWQRKLAREGGTKTGSPLSPNSVRLASSPLAGAFKRGALGQLRDGDIAAAVGWYSAGSFWRRLSVSAQSCSG